MLAGKGHKAGMNDELFRMMELYQQGFNCSQILLLLGLENLGRSSPDLIRAMTGLGGGLGFSGKICGALTGGVCLLGLYAGRGALEEKEHDRFLLLIDELVQWFEGEAGRLYGGINCADILGEELTYRVVTPKCGTLIGSTYNKVKEILVSNGINPAGEEK